VKLKIKGMVAVAATTAITASMLVLGGSAANAATAPNWEPDSGGSVGSLTFYDTSHPFVKYAVASTTTPDTGSAAKAYLAIYTPDGTTHTYAWSGEGMTSNTPYPNSADPASVRAGGHPYSTATTADFSLNNYFADFQNTQAAPQAGLYQVRLYTAYTAGLGSGKYFSADISVSTSDASSTTGTWQVVYPTPPPQPGNPQVSTPVATPVSPGAHNTSVTLTANVTPVGIAGTVQLLDGSTSVGTPTYTQATGAVSTTVTPGDGDHSYTYKFTPTDATSFNASTSSALAYHVNGIDATSTVLTGSTTGVVGTSQNITATVSDTSTSATIPVGNVQFTVDGTNTALLAVGASGTAVYNYTPADTLAHTIKGTFIPTNANVFSGSSDTTGVSVTATPIVSGPGIDPQNVQTTVAPGTLTISTPYTAANPFSLGTMVLSADGNTLSASAAFGDSAVAAASDPGNGVGASTTNGVTITDTRSGSTGWTASAKDTDFTSTTSTSILGANLGFTHLAAKYPTGNKLAGHVITTDIAALSTTTATAFATTTYGPGTVNITGTMGLSNVPTSTKPGVYNATVTFTIL
jgi:hypothetical protein